MPADAERTRISKPPISMAIPITKPYAPAPPSNLPTAEPKVSEKTHGILASQDVRFSEPRSGINTILEQKMTEIVNLPREEIDVEERRKRTYKDRDPYREEPK